MAALDAKLAFQGWAAPTLVKVAGLTEFASGTYPIERMLLDLREPKTRQAANTLARLPWAGFLVDSPEDAPADRPWIVANDQALALGPGDVIEVIPANGKVARRYRRGANNNILFATERCNSFCLMCSQPPRQIEDDWRVAHLCDLVALIDRDTPSLTITGGEPTLLGEDLNRVVAHCASVLPNTALHILSNGRNFEKPGLAQGFDDLHPALTWGIPLYGDTYALHDYIVQSQGAYAQTLRGLYALEAAHQRIEIRVVLVRPVVERLPALARFIYRNLPFVSHVALMGTEPTGFARAHHDMLWIDPTDMSSPLAESVDMLARRDIPVSLYNLPLCTLPKALWPHAQQSISDWKQHYLPACENCQARNRCGGFFAWVTDPWTSRAIKPVRDEETTCVRP